MKKQINFIKKYTEIYSKISFSNHLIVILLLILISNWIFITFDLSAYFLVTTIVLIFFLSLIRGNLKFYDIEVNNNGQITNFINVKYSYDKKKDCIIIYDRTGRTTQINQGNYTIIEHINP